ncbi:DNA-primase RepB domain-containing protein [Methylobacterium sp. WL7]|uniref:DNA-primase RepB domain-containing protein n=1 Tax=Methylobacterium sp. WL7 TaxID=2603900 RepID=UPI0011C825FB|nr:DNA-primase RepB domain-containing protein [Methylobacterium sp. WL7]TXN42921.1 hypothetical protein FV233_20695 [Methylobacterium sp. WL7]
MEEPAKRALHGLSESVAVAVDASEYSPELGARQDQPFADIGEKPAAERPQVDLGQVRTFLERLHALAATATAGLQDPGQLQLFLNYPDRNDSRTEQFAIGDVDHMVGEAVRQSNAGFNVYVEARTVRKRARGERGRGTEADTVAVFALVVDDDADKGKGANTAVEPSFAVESSPGNTHRWYGFVPALSGAAAKELGLALRAETGGDSDTGVITQPYRVAGTVNYPTKAKRARGRVPVDTKSLALDGPVRSTDEMRTAFPYVAPPKVETEIPEGLTGQASEGAEALLAVPEGRPGLDRSAQFHRAAWAAYHDGLTVEDFEEMARRHPEGCAAKFLTGKDRLRVEAKRSYASIAAAIAARSVGPEAEPVEPTYPDRRVSLEEGEVRLREMVGSFLPEYVLPYRVELAAWQAQAEDAKQRGAPLPPKPTPRAFVIKSSTGLGKTRQIEALIEKSIEEGLTTVYAGPHHDGLKEMKSRLTARPTLFVEDVEIWRGRKQPDPEAPGQTMCRDLHAYSDAVTAGVDLYEATCRYGEFRCEFFKVCGTQRQRAAKPKVWLVTHASLFSPRPVSMAPPDFLIIDESPLSNALPSRPVDVAFDAFDEVDPAKVEAAFVTLGRVPVDPDRTLFRGNDQSWFKYKAAVMKGYNDQLYRALRSSGDGELTRSVLEEAGIDIRMAQAARKGLELTLCSVRIVPGMTARERLVQIAAARANRPAKNVMMIWREMERFFQEGHAGSGRLIIGRDEATGARVLALWPLSRLSEGWRAPILFSDATAPPGAALEPLFGMPVDKAAEIEVRFGEGVTVTQILGAPVTATKLGTTEDADDDEDDGRLSGGGGDGDEADEKLEGEDPKRSRRDVLRYIQVRAAMAAPGQVGVICTKKLRRKLETAGLPRNVDILHFGALAGLDGWKDHCGAIIIGRQMPGPLAFEPQAGALFGAAIRRCPPPLPPARMTWYPRVLGGLRMADGSAVRVEHERHPDPWVEVLRWQGCEAQILQAIGRFRLLRREADRPCFVDLISDFPLPLTLDRVVRWRKVKPGAWAGLIRGGIVLTREADLMAAHGLSRKAARLAVPPATLPGHEPPASALTPIRVEPYRERGPPGGDVRAPRRAVFKRRGAGEVSAAYLFPEAPSAPGDLLAVLEALRLGPIEWIEADGGPRVSGPGTPEAIGIVLDSHEDTAKLHSEIYRTAKAAERARAKTGAAPKPVGWVPFRYKHAGARQKWRTGRYNPAEFDDHAHVRARIELGLELELVAFEVVEQPDI